VFALLWAPEKGLTPPAWGAGDFSTGFLGIIAPAVTPGFGSIFELRGLRQLEFELIVPVRGTLVGRGGNERRAFHQLSMGCAPGAGFAMNLHGDAALRLNRLIATAYADIKARIGNGRLTETAEEADADVNGQLPITHFFRFRGRLRDVCGCPIGSIYRNVCFI
jgi:hypothetical protein